MTLMNGLLIAGAVAVAFIALRCLAVVRARRAEATYPPEGAFLTVEGVRLHFVRKGPPGRQPVVLLHGSDGFLQDFPDSLIESLAREHDVLAFDRPGHGYSDPPRGEPATPKVQARLLCAALDQLEIERPVLVGHSWSGLLLMVLALDCPERFAGLVLVGGWIYAPTSPPSLTMIALQIPILGRFLASTLLVPVKSRIILRQLLRAFAPAPVPEAYARMACALWQRWPWQTSVFVQENLTALPLMRSLHTRYPQVALPILLLTGDSDKEVEPAQHAYRLHRELPQSELIVVPHAGHELLRTHPEQIIAAIERVWEIATMKNREPRQTTVLSPSMDSVDDYHRARELVFRYGWNPMAYQILIPNIDYWFTPDGEGVVGYVTCRRVRVVAGVPICAESRLGEVLLAFEQEAALYGERVCWFGATVRMQTQLAALPPHAVLCIGAQPAWDPRHWPAILKQNSSLRAQLNRARNKGVSISEWPVERANANPALQRCLDEWLATRTLPTLHFLTEPVDLARLADRRIFVAEAQGAPIGYLIATPVPHRNGWLVEQIVRGHSAPNGTAELLVDAVMRALAEGDYPYVTLGLAPLSRRAPQVSEPPSLGVRLLLAWGHAHGQRFYNFAGLDAFKAKFKPDTWEPLFAIANEPRFSFGLLYAMASAFSNGALGPFIGRTLWSALRQELAWFHARVKTK